MPLSEDDVSTLFFACFVSMSFPSCLVLYLYVLLRLFFSLYLFTFILLLVLASLRIVRVRVDHQRSKTT